MVLLNRTILIICLALLFNLVLCTKQSKHGNRNIETMLNKICNDNSMEKINVLNKKIDALGFNHYHLRCTTKDSVIYLYAIDLRDTVIYSEFAYSGLIELSRFVKMNYSVVEMLNDAYSHYFKNEIFDYTSQKTFFHSTLYYYFISHWDQLLSISDMTIFLMSIDKELIKCYSIHESNFDNINITNIYSILFYRGVVLIFLQPGGNIQLKLLYKECYWPIT